MIYDHRIKYKGVWYKAGVEVPHRTNAEIDSIETKSTQSDINEKVINRMSLAQLRQVCEENGIEYVEEDTKSVLKAKIIERLNIN